MDLRNRLVRGSVGIILMTLILCIVLVAHHYIGPYHPTSEELITVGKGTVIESILATGALKATATVQVGSEVSGVIREVSVDYNSRVRKGQRLALIDPDVPRAQLAQAQANLGTSKANLARQAESIHYSEALVTKAEVQLNEAEINFKRIQQLYQTGVMPASQLDTAAASRHSAYAQKQAQEAYCKSEIQAMRAAEAQVSQNEEAVNLAQIALHNTEITSPMDGVVIERNIDPGQTVAASFQAPTLFVIATDLSQLELHADVAEADIGKVHVGEDAAFEVDAFPGKLFATRVREIHPGPTIVQRQVTYAVITTVDNSNRLLKPGMTANVWIETSRKENALAIPTLAIREEKGKKYVYLLEKRGSRRKEIITGLKGTNGLTEILSGLNEGERVALPSVHQ